MASGVGEALGSFLLSFVVFRGKAEGGSLDGPVCQVTGSVGFTRGELGDFDALVLVGHGCLPFDTV